jgi:hypothetical protein
MRACDNSSNVYELGLEVLIRGKGRFLRKPKTSMNQMLNTKLHINQYSIETTTVQEAQCRAYIRLIMERPISTGMLHVISLALIPMAATFPGQMLVAGRPSLV